MKISLSAAAVVTASLLTMTTAKAVNFDTTISLLEPVPEDSSAWTLTTQDFNNETHLFEVEHAWVTGQTPAKLPGDEDGVHWGLLLEPDGSAVSDILKLTILNGATGQDPATVTLEMWSDGFKGSANSSISGDFATILEEVPAGTPSVKETGDPQLVSGTGFLFPDRSGKLLIWVSSDAEEDPNSPPEGSLPDGGATMVLLGGGISALALVRRMMS